MRVIIQDDYQNTADWVAYYIMRRIRHFNPTQDRPFILGLPTGSSPIGIYQKLIEYYKSHLKYMSVSCSFCPHFSKRYLKIYHHDN